MSRFYFGGSDSSDPDDDNLPYPTPLARSAFLAPDFNPTTYLSTLRNRHQTLEDLRSELRARSQLLSKELLDLVNTNYNDFLNLGTSLKGGEEKVEEVRVGLLGFQRDVEGLRKKVAERETEVSSLIDQRSGLRKNIAIGTCLLNVAARLDELEARLMVESEGKKNGDANGYVEFSESDEESDDDEVGPREYTSGYISSSRLSRLVQQYVYIQRLMSRVGPEHPFVIAQDPRMTRARNTLLLDMGTALKQSQAAGDAGRTRIVRLLGVYRDMGEAGEALQLLRGNDS
ncbi:MAG: hypothetical protein M1833_001884 [Piccolia ochrophora]|nr:MAG: hypothetical protein M1833_001884 [Piccolia ochrophora]